MVVITVSILRTLRTHFFVVHCVINLTLVLQMHLFSLPQDCYNFLCLGLPLNQVDFCPQVCPKNAANFNVDNVRVVKIPGGGAGDSRVVKGMVVKRATEGIIQDVHDAKVAVFAQGVDAASTETKVCGFEPRSAQFRLFVHLFLLILHVIRIYELFGSHGW